IQVKPELAEAHCNLGHALRDRGQLSEALAELERGHRLGSKNPNWRYPSGEWVIQCRRMIERGDKPPVVPRAEAKAERGGREATVAALREATRLKPDNAEAHVNLGDFLLKARELDGAIAAFRAAIRLKPDLAPAHTKLGLALMGEGDKSAAIAAFRTAIRLK